MKPQEKKLLPAFLIIAFVASLLSVNPVSSATPLLKMDPSILYAASGQSFKVNITVSNVELLYAWQVNMSFDPNVLEFVNATEGDFLKRQPEGSYQAGLRMEEDWVLFGWATRGIYPGESGSGLLGAAEFKVIGVGESDLKFEKVGNMTILMGQTADLFPPNFYEIPFTAEHSFFTNLETPPVADFTYSPEIPRINVTTTFDASASSATPPLQIIEYFWDFGDGTNATVTTPTVKHNFTTGGLFTVSLTVFDNASMPTIWYELYGTKKLILNVAFAHDLAVKNVVPLKKKVAVGEIVSINVTVWNKGIETESFNVTAYYDTNKISTLQVESLSEGEEESLLFNWDTTDVAEGDYQIKAVASAVEGEVYFDDNEFIDGTVTVEEASQALPTTLIIGGVIGVGLVLAVILVVYMRRRGSST